MVFTNIYNKHLEDENEDEEEEKQRVTSFDEKKWSLSELLDIFNAQDLNDIFEIYTGKINHGFFSLYLILCFFLSLTHASVIFFSVENNESLIIDLPDIIFYIIVILFSLILIISIDTIVRRTKKWDYIQIFWLLLIGVMNFFVPMYHHYKKDANLRPAYSSILVLSCYVFFNVFKFTPAIISGSLVSLCHIMIMWFMTYVDSPKTWQRILSDILFQICINGLGIYFRYISDIVKRRSFLDRRECVVSTFEIEDEQKQQVMLLLSIIPEHFFEKVKQTFESKVVKFKNDNINEYTDVTILFADIVNYTNMTKNLEIKELLDTLNKMFCAFDDASDKHKVTRIKFLGDCYYCVAGMPPNPPENHAEACVDLGLEMIKIIARVRQEKNLNVDMRIGIHSGSIMGGIIGIVKIQFDIWSDDVSLANTMETEGVAGKVHITQTTKNLLKKQYNIEEKKATESTKVNMQTYLISPDDSPETPRRHSKFQKRDILLHQMQRLSEAGIIKDGENSTDSTDSLQKKVSFVEQEQDPSQKRLSFVEQESMDLSHSLQKRLSFIEETQYDVDCPDSALQPRLTFVEQNIVDSLEQEDNEQATEETSEVEANITPVRRPTYLKRNEKDIRKLEETIDGSSMRISSKSVSFMDQGNPNRNSEKSLPNNSIKDVGAVRRLTTNRKPVNSFGGRYSGERRRTGEQRRTAFMKVNKKRFEERQKKVGEEIKKEIDKMTFSKYEQFIKNKDINAFMFFRNYENEIKYFKQMDPLFKYYVAFELIVLICVYLIQNLTLDSWDVSGGWPFYMSAGVILLVLIPLTWMHFIWNKFIDLNAPKNRFLKYIYNLSELIARNSTIRHCIYVITSLILSYCVLSEAVECIERTQHSEAEVKYNLLYILMKKQQVDWHIQCMIPWHMTETCALALLMTFIFLKILIWVKLVIGLIVTSVYAYCVFSFSDGFYQNSETFNYEMKPQVAHFLALLFISFTLHLIDRQTDYMNRKDFLLNNKLKKHKKEADKIKNNNRRILLNILPEHVAEEYLNTTRKSDELYSELDHKNVAVMFATIIYDTFDGITQRDFLNSMNECISEFDKITLRTEFKSIEKIKIAKWTYMVACGLERETEGQREKMHVLYHVEPITTLIKFAAEMMKKLKECNSNMMQDFRLRIGISHGPLVAGVVGSKKPLYDIWGHPVNMASRMDTTGEENKIQVLEETAIVIQELGYQCQFRGKVMVKGIGEARTYFVCLDKNYNLIKINDQRD